MKQLNIDFPTKTFSYYMLENKGSKQAKVLAAISYLKRCSDSDIAEYLGWPINRVTGRRNELMELGMILLEGVKVGRFGKPVKVYELNELTKLEN